MPLSFDEELRYSRHLVLPGVGLHGQERLQQARVLVVGAGGLGSPAALYLAAAGVGAIGIVDGDVVDVTNLQRQILHRHDQINRSKVSSACSTLNSLNPLVRVEPIDVRLNAANAYDIIEKYDLVIDGSDNFPTRYLLNDACGLLGKPLVFGSIFRFEGQASVFHAQSGPCYRCLFPSPPPPHVVPTCAEGGVLGALPGIIGTTQAMEALKLLLGIGRPLLGRLLLFDALEMRFQEVRFEKNPDCPLCGNAPTINSLSDHDAYCDLSAVTPECDWEMMPDVFHELIAHNVICLVDVREEWEYNEAPGLPEAISIPFSSFTRRMPELDSAEQTVIYCSRGIRSWHAAALLRRAGFEKVWSVKGGLHALANPD